MTKISGILGIASIFDDCDIPSADLGSKTNKWVIGLGPASVGLENIAGKILDIANAAQELKEAAAMFAPVLQGQAQKRIPMIDEAKQRIDQMLKDSISPQSLEQDLEILEKALECRKADIEKAQDTGKEYFMELLGDLQEAAKDLEPLTNALVKIKQYSD